MNVRRATIADVAAIASFHTSCWREAYAGLVPEDYLQRVGDREREARWRERIGRELRSVVVAEENGVMQGVVSWALGSDKELELTSLYVAAAARGTGLAGELFTEAIGSKAAYLWVFEANARAIRFYANHGFLTIGVRESDVDTGLWQIQMRRLGESSLFGGS